MQALESSKIPLSKYFWYLYTGGKFKYTYMGLLFRKVVYTRYDVPSFIEELDFTDIQAAYQKPPFYIYIYILN
jgi:hypothetical protein